MVGVKKQEDKWVSILPTRFADVVELIEIADDILINMKKLSSQMPWVESFYREFEDAIVEALAERLIERIQDEFDLDYVCFDEKNPDCDAVVETDPDSPTGLMPELINVKEGFVRQ